MPDVNERRRLAPFILIALFNAVAFAVAFSLRKVSDYSAGWWLSAMFILIGITLAYVVLRQYKALKPDSGNFLLFWSCMLPTFLYYPILWLPTMPHRLVFGVAVGAVQTLIVAALYVLGSRLFGRSSESHKLDPLLLGLLYTAITEGSMFLSTILGLYYCKGVCP